MTIRYMPAGLRTLRVITSQEKSPPGYVNIEITVLDNPTARWWGMA